MTRKEKLTKRTMAILVLGGLMAASPGDARALTVPNYLRCDLIGKCRQINGSYLSTVPTWCKRTVVPVTDPNRSISLCSKWVNR